MASAACVWVASPERIISTTTARKLAGVSFPWPSDAASISEALAMIFARSPAIAGCQLGMSALSVLV
jgi:hypothetical protein